MTSADAALVTTGVNAHVTVALAALNAGLGILMEALRGQPRGRGRIGMLAEARGLPLMVSQSADHGSAPLQGRTRTFGKLPFLCHATSNVAVPPARTELLTLYALEPTETT